MTLRIGIDTGGTFTDLVGFDDEERAAARALDRAAEDAVFANLRAYARDKVVFLISHRLYHFPEMQKIIFMADGKTTVGTHEELLRKDGVYAHLYNI